MRRILYLFIYLFLTPNQHIRMISEVSRDTVGVMMLEMSFIPAITGIELNILNWKQLF